MFSDEGRGGVSLRLGGGQALAGPLPGAAWAAPLLSDSCRAGPAAAAGCTRRARRAAGWRMKRAAARRRRACGTAPRSPWRTCSTSPNWSSTRRGQTPQVRAPALEAGRGASSAPRGRAGGRAQGRWLGEARRGAGRAAQAGRPGLLLLSWRGGRAGAGGWRLWRHGTARLGGRAARLPLTQLPGAARVQSGCGGGWRTRGRPTRALPPWGCPPRRWPRTQTPRMRPRAAAAASASGALPALAAAAAAAGGSSGR